ncbi:hypothetical protein ACMFMG_003001 [Clarireedia jacksonii]
MPPQTLTSPLFRLLTPLLQSTSRTAPSISALIPQAQSRTFTNTASTPKKANPQAKKGDPRISLIRYHLQHPETPRPLRFSRLRALRHWTIHRAWMLLRRKKREAEEAELYRCVFSFVFRFHSRARTSLRGPIPILNCYTTILPHIPHNAPHIHSKSPHSPFQLLLFLPSPSPSVAHLLQLTNKSPLNPPRLYQSMHSAMEELRKLDGAGQEQAGRLYRIALEKKGIFSGENGIPIEYARAQTDTPGRPGEVWNHGWTR